MAKNSQIEWTHHTFNPWWGCAKISPACQNCYADLWARRMGHKIWGATAPRRFFTDTHWKEPLTWNADAQIEGVRHRVFCASMSDVFEAKEELNIHRERLWELINATPWLDWLLLTKRPENIETMAPWAKKGVWPENVWLGTTVENQEYAKKRLPHLLKHSAAIRFLSCEPLLGPLDLSLWLKSKKLFPIDWVIAGGESGPGARPMHPDWPEALMTQCDKNDVAFHFKQWGHWVPAELVDEHIKTNLMQLGSEKPVHMARLSKKNAGRILKGGIRDGIPTIRFKYAT